MRLIDADFLKEDLTRFYDGEVTARQLIDKQPTVEPEQRWISCSERLPEENDCYLVQAMMNGDIFVAKWEGSYWNVKTPIIAWMPLPARYKGDDTERTISDLCRNWDDLLAKTEIVRCKDCKFAHITNDRRYCKLCDMFTDDYGQLIEMYFDSNFYCGYAERRNNDL